ncbi:DgyrCDS8885 [Dimorphilus gyrociliatus]|uniref:DgyrCDS8885 n=1 Tax=Dimorphilus gyrociliatus TaxID=2664684 RepID=A0A7I8VWZ0_9ANNE|nr:DgyrCDS8885 [Dimorphilus gyrociliatus]
MTTENFDKILREEKENRLATLAFIKVRQNESKMCGTIEVDLENVIPLVTIARMLVVEEIVKECEYLLLDFLTVKNSLSMAFLADVFELEELKIATSTALETLLFSENLLKQIVCLPFEGILWLIQQEVFQSCSNFTVEAVMKWLKGVGSQEDYDILLHILADSYGIDTSNLPHASELLNRRLHLEILHTSSNETMEEMLVFINLNSISIMFYSPTLNNWFSFPLKCSQDDLFPIGALKSGKMLVRKKTGSQLFAVNIRDQEKPKETVSPPKHNNWKNVTYGICEGKYICLQRNGQEMRLVKLKEVKSKFIWKPWPVYTIENLPIIEGKLIFVGGPSSHIVLSENWYQEEKGYMILRKNVYPFNFIKIPYPKCACSNHKPNGQGTICLLSLAKTTLKVYMNLSQTYFRITLVINSSENFTTFNVYNCNLLDLTWTFTVEKIEETLKCTSGISNLYLIRKHDQVYVTKAMHADHKVILPPLRFERIIHEFRCVMLPKCLLEKADINRNVEVEKGEEFNFEWMKLLPY